MKRLLASAFLLSATSLSANDFDRLSVSKNGLYQGNLGKGIRGRCAVEVQNIKMIRHTFGLRKKLKSLTLTTNLLPNAQIHIECTYYGVGEQSCRANLGEDAFISLRPGVTFYNSEHTEYRLPHIAIYENNKLVSQCVDLQRLNDL